MREKHIHIGNQGGQESGASSTQTQNRRSNREWNGELEQKLSQCNDTFSLCQLEATCMPKSLQQRKTLLYETLLA